MKKNTFMPSGLKENNLAEEVRIFVEENLANSGVNLVKAKSNISYRQLTKLYHPIGPGKMILNGEGLPSISKKTGYSLSYLKKIINPPSK